MTMVMTREQATAAAEAAQRDGIQANLLELDGYFGKRLLDGASLTGETKKRWDAATAELATFGKCSWPIRRAIGAVPETSSHHVAAQIAAVRIYLTRSKHAGVTPDDLRQAGVRLGRLKLDAARQQHLTAEILRAALDCETAGQPVGNGQLLGRELTERALRFGPEKSYRALARLAPEEARRINLVDLVNEVRPRTWS